MDRVNILFLTDVLYSVHGGAEGILWKMVHYLPQDRYRCSIATFSSYPELVVKSAFECPVHLLPIRRMYDWQALKASVQLGRLIRSKRVSIVHTFFPASDLLGALVAKLSGCPIVISSRRDMGFQRSALQRLAYRLGRGLHDQVQTVSESVARQHREQDRLDADKVVTVWNGVDLEDIDEARPAFALSELGLADASPVVVCVANVRPVKALEVLVATCAIVCRELPGTRFLVVGDLQDRGYFERVEALARELNVRDKVVFAGRRVDVPAVLRASNVFFLPSHSEGLSNAMLEAMACSLSCVATDVGGNRELIDDSRNGFLVPAKDAEGAAERILRLLRNPRYAAWMGREGRRKVEERFSLQAMINRLTQLYEELLVRAEARTPYLERGGSAPLAQRGEGD